MSLYALHKICHGIRKNPGLRDALKRDPAGTLAGFRLTEQEREALLRGDVRALHEMGVHGYVLGNLARFELFGLTTPEYVRRLKKLP